MEGFWKIALVLFSVLYPALGHMIVSTEDKLGDCLLASTDRLANNTIRISIEAEVATERRSLEDTVSRFLARNDAVVVDLDSKESCSIFIRLYLVDSTKSFKNLVDRQHSQECDTSSGAQYYFVVLSNTVFLEEILNLCWKAYILNVNVLIEDENKTVTLYTYYPFTKFNCRGSTPTIHNRFINGNFEWNKELFPQKMDNLWQCPIEVIVWNQPPFVWIENNQINGLNGDILKTLSTMMNFSIEMVISPKARGVFHPKINVTGSYKLLQNGLGDISLGASSCTSETRAHFASTTSFYTGYSYAVVRRPKLYKALHVIFLPFDTLTWLSLFTILFAKWICALLWKKYGNRCVAFRYCSTRLHTMAWLYAMFIVRSSYEGSIFRFLQRTPIQWIPESIDEAIDNRYKFIARSYSYSSLVQYPQLVDHLVLDESSLPTSTNFSVPNILSLLTAYKGNYGAVGTDMYLSLCINDSSMHDDYALIRTPISIINYCMEMQKYSFLTKAINTRIQWLLANGYMQRNYVKHIPIHNLMKKGKPVERASISLHHINGAFILLAICTAFSVFVFIAELFAERFRWLKKLLELFY